MANLERWLRRAGRGTQAPAIILVARSAASASPAASGGAEFQSFSWGATPPREPIPATRTSCASRRPHEFPERWVELLEHIGSRLPAPGVLFPLGDAHTLLVARHREALESHFHFLIPDTATVEGIVDKRSQYRIAEGAGVPIPAVHFPDSVEEARRVSGQVPYPSLLKPHVSHTARLTLDGKVLVVESPADLVSAYERISAAGVQLMVQEIVPGEDTALLGYLAFWDGEGRELAWLDQAKAAPVPAAVRRRRASGHRRRLRRSPSSAGACCVRSVTAASSAWSSS